MKCEKCKYFRTYDSEPYFKPTPICIRHNNLKEAIDATINSNSCEYKEEIDLTQIPKIFNKLSEACKKMSEAFKKFAEELDEKN